MTPNEVAAAAEKWPNLTHQTRDKLLSLCQSVGVDVHNQWLSEAACEAIGKLAASHERMASALATIANHDNVYDRRYEFRVLAREALAAVEKGNQPQ